MRFLGLLGAIPQIIVVTAVMMYVAKRFSVEAVLMMVGSIIGLMSSIFYVLVLPWLSEAYGMAWYPSYAALIGVVGTLGGLCFAIGLLLLVLKILKS